MIEKQREKEFLFELEQICNRFSIVIDSPDDFQLYDLSTTVLPIPFDKQIRKFIKYLETER